MSLVPIIAMFVFLLNNSSGGEVLLIYRPMGGSLHSPRSVGYEDSVKPRNVMPFLESDSSSSAEESSSFLHSFPLYLEKGPRMSSISDDFISKSSVALPMFEISACPILGSNPKILFRAHNPAFSTSVFMLAKV